MMKNELLILVEQMAKLHRAIYEELCLQAQQKFDTKKFEKELINVGCKTKSAAHESLLDGESQNSTTEIAAIVTVKIEDSFPSDQFENSAVPRPNLGNRKKKSVTMKMSKKDLDKARKKNEEAFDIWKQEKTKTLRRALKEEHLKKQAHFVAQQKEYDKRRAAYEVHWVFFFQFIGIMLLEKSKKLIHQLKEFFLKVNIFFHIEIRICVIRWLSFEQAHIRWKKLQASQPKVNKLPKKTVKNDCLKMLELANEKIAVNEEASRVWKKQKNGIARQQSQQRRQVRILNYDSGFEFAAWLDRLDLLLHQKYMRERRYLVRSFYCQPAYYGSAALCMN
ncbi:uncharacterized protein [Venturia canescens]|uniref:uncharacterized protein n=1 Tax=Venturia canescens TaxID=32260 RepID=UPI001C9BC64C|nr:uncharacterized protein LOC122409784 [Venturia canescens]